MLVTAEKHEAGHSILTGFGSSSGSGSSTDEACEREEFLDDFTRQMAVNMLQDDDDDEKEAEENKTKTTLFEPDNLGKKYGEVKERGDGSRGAGFVSPNGSGMRVVLLGESGSRNGSGGTGVFIPHATATLPNHQLRRRQLRQGRCSSVLIPERVLNSLKQHHEKRNASQAHSNAMFPARRNGSFQHRETPNKAVVNNHQETPNKAAVNNDDDDDDDEFQLPREWTY